MRVARELAASNATTWAGSQGASSGSVRTNGHQLPFLGHRWCPLRKGTKPAQWRVCARQGLQPVTFRRPREAFCRSIPDSLRYQMDRKSAGWIALEGAVHKLPGGHSGAFGLH